MSAELIIRMYGAHQIIILVCIQQSLRFFQHMPLQPVSPICTTHNCRIHDCNMGKLFLIKIKISSQIIFPVFRIFNNEETRNRTICCLCHDHKTLFFYMCPDIFLIIASCITAMISSTSAISAFRILNNTFAEPSLFSEICMML